MSCAQSYPRPRCDCRDFADCEFCFCGRLRPLWICLTHPNRLDRRLLFRSTCKTRVACAGSRPSIEQNGARYQVWEMAQPTKAADNTFSFVAGVKSTPQLKDGKAKLIVEATSNDLRRKTTRLERDVSSGDSTSNGECRFRTALPLSGHGRSRDFQRLAVAGARRVCAWAIKPFGRGLCRAANLECFRSMRLRGICPLTRFRRSLPATARGAT